MHLKSTIFFGFVIACCLIQAKEKLELSIDKERYQVGSHIRASLTLKGAIITPDPQGKIESNLFFSKTDGPPALSYAYIIVAKEEGTHDLGPFQIKVGDEEFVSNSVRYTVFEPEKDGLTLSISSQTIPKGKEFSILLISPRELEAPTLRKNKMFEYKRMSTSQSMVFSSSEGRSEEYQYEFVVEAKRKGKLKISSELFKDLPDDVTITVADITIF